MRCFLLLLLIFSQNLWCVDVDNSWQVKYELFFAEKGDLRIRDNKSFREYISNPNFLREVANKYPEIKKQLPLFFDNPDNVLEVYRNNKEPIYRELELLYKMIPTLNNQLSDTD